jgi:hypothetical protein
VAKTGDNSSTISLDDPRWWLLGETLKYCRSHPLFRLQDLAAAVDQEQVRSKLEYLDQSTRPAKRIVMRLTSEFFQREAAIIVFWNSLALKVRTEKAARMRPYALSFWSPDVKKFCTVGGALVVPQAAKRRGKVERWVYNDMVSHSSEIFSSDYVTKLCGRNPYSVTKGRIQNIVGHYRTEFKAAGRVPKK